MNEYFIPVDPLSGSAHGRGLLGEGIYIHIRTRGNVNTVNKGSPRRARGPVCGDSRPTSYYSRSVGFY